MRSKKIRGKALLLIVFSCLFFLIGCSRPREKYDSDGRLIESIYKIDKGYYVRTEYEYDESGNLILKHPVKFFNGEEEPMLDERYAYDDRGRMISSEEVYFDGRVLDKWLYYYNDDDDSPYLTECYDGEGTLTNWNEYEREKNGESRMRQYEVTKNGSYLKAIVYYTSDGQAKKREEFSPPEEAFPPLRVEGFTRYAFCKFETHDEALRWIAETPSTDVGGFDTKFCTVWWGELTGLPRHDARLVQR